MRDRSQRVCHAASVPRTAHARRRIYSSTAGSWGDGSMDKSWICKCEGLRSNPSAEPKDKHGCLYLPSQHWGVGRAKDGCSLARQPSQASGSESIKQRTIGAHSPASSGRHMNEHVCAHLTFMFVHVSVCARAHTPQRWGGWRARKDSALTLNSWPPKL